MIRWPDLFLHNRPGKGILVYICIISPKTKRIFYQLFTARLLLSILPNLIFHLSKIYTMKLQLIALTAFVTFVIAAPHAEKPGSAIKREAMAQVRRSSTFYTLL